MNNALGNHSNEGSKESIDQMVEYALLYDFYGALLSEKNGRIFEDYMFNDMSLSEIAEDAGISRQGVSDVVRRSGKKLIQYEENLGLIKRFVRVKSLVCNMKDETLRIQDSLSNIVNEDVNSNDYFIVKNISSYLDNISNQTDSILEEL